MTAPRAPELLRALAGGRERLLQAIAGVSEEQFKRRPQADGPGPVSWCIAEVLAHLLDQEKRTAGAIELALTQPSPQISGTPAQEELAAARAGRAAPVPQLIHGLLASRRALQRLLESALAGDAAALDRPLRHELHGLISLERLVRLEVLDHEAEHTAQIEALRDAAGAAPHR